MTAKTSLAGKQPWPHSSPCCLLKFLVAWVLLEDEACVCVCVLLGGLIPGASALDGFCLYLAHGNSLPV